jgi:putative phosphoesterase
MKLLFIADIHANASALAKVLARFYYHKADYLVCAGDIVPFNAFRRPAEGDATVASLLNGIASKVIACKGNNDSVGDQSAFGFPMLCEAVSILADRRRFYVTHGHLYSFEDIAPTLAPGDVFVSGHTHVALLGGQRGVIALNPGSVSTPRGREGPSYALYDGAKSTLELCLLDGKVFNKLKL